MQSCTECGTAISPAVGPPVLLNGKVVCQPCWQRVDAEAAAAPAASTRPASSPSSRVGSATRRTTGGPITPPTSARRQTSATPASRRSTSNRAEATPATRSDRSTSRRSTPAEGEAERLHARATSRTATLIEEVESSTSGERLKIYIVVIMCVMVIGAGIAGFIWYSKTTRDKEDAQRLETESNAAMENARGIVKTQPENWDAQEAAFNKAEPVVKGFPVKRNELSNMRSEMIGKRDSAKTKAENLKLLEDIKKDIADPAKRQNVKILLDRAKVVRMDDKAYQEEVTKLIQLLTLNTLKDYLDAAKAKEASGDLQAALAAYDDAVKKFNKEFDENQGRPSTPEILNLYKELLAESDRLVERVETPEYEAQVPERDLLSAKERQAAGWGKSAGIEMNFAARELEIKGVEVDPNKKITGVASFGLIRENPWHDLILEMNFTIVSGSFQMFLRYWPDKRNFMLNFDQKSGYELNKPYQVTLRIKGSKVEMTQPDQNPQNDVLTANTSRTGGIGFGLNPGSKIIISSLKLKLLRPKT